MINATNDTANGERLAADCAQSIRWVTDWRCWVVWDGRRWSRQPDDTGVEGLAKLTALAVADEARAVEDPELSKVLLKWAAKSLDMPRIRAMVANAKSVPAIRVESSAFDRDPFALNVGNGIVDLRTGGLRPHDPLAMITRLVPHDYDKTADSPLWRSLLGRTTQLDVAGDTAKFLEMVLGYMLVGGNPEHRMFFLIGPGGTGKSQTVEIPTRVLGNDYAWTSKPSLITRGRSDVHTEEVAILESKRFISISETDGSMRLDEAAFKTYTGQSHMAVRRLYGAQHQARIDASVIVGTNEAPIIAKFDDAVKRRLVIVPSGPPLSAAEKDTGLRDKIVETEAEGVLSSLVHGAVAWWDRSQSLANGHTRPVFDTDLPEAVRKATEAFAYEHDPVIQFVDERLDFVAGAVTPMPAVMAEYKRYAAEAGGVGRRALFERIVEIGTERGAVVSKDKRAFRGLRILPMTESAPFG